VTGQRPGDIVPGWPALPAQAPSGPAAGIASEEIAVEGEVVDGELTAGTAVGEVIRAEVLSTGLDGPTEFVSSTFPAAEMPYAGAGYPHAPAASSQATVPTPPQVAAATPQAAAPSPWAPNNDRTVPYQAPQYPQAKHAPAQFPASQHLPAQHAPYSPLVQGVPYSAPPAAPVTSPPWAPPGPAWGGGAVPPTTAPPGAPYQGFPPPYYAPEPPRRNRRGLIVTLVIAGFLVLALCAGLIGYGLPSILGRDDATTPSATAKPAATTLPADATDDQIVQAVLDAQSTALLKGDEAGFMAPVDPAAPSAVSAYKRLFHNMTQMHVTVWKTSSGSLVDLSEGPQTFTMDITYCLNTPDCGNDMRATMKVTAAKKGGKVRFEALAAPKANSATNSPLPWQVSTLAAVAGTRVVLAASSKWASRLTKVLPVAESAAVAANKYAKWGTPPVYVVYLASASEGKTWFHGGLKNADGVSFTIGPRDIQIMIMMPYATEAAYAGPGGINAVIQHEMGHVVTLRGATDRSIDHDDFIEGIAEYISYTGHSSWAKYRIYDTRAYIHSHRFNKCYLTDQIVSSNILTSSAAYGIGYLTMRYLATKYGQDKMLTFWGAYERDGLSLDAAARQTFGTSWSSVNSSCVSYVRHAVGA
jgi:hypothetical protein